MRYPAGIAALALLLAACGGGPPSRIEPRIDPDTRVLSPQSRASLSSFTLNNAPTCLDYTNQTARSARPPSPLAPTTPSSRPSRSDRCW